MANAMAVNDSPLKGSSPVPAKTIVTAHDHMSAAALTRVPASCSGAMNAGVPAVTSPEKTVVIPGTAASPKSITTGPSGARQDIAGREVAMDHPGGMHRAQRGQRGDGDALKCGAAAGPELLDDFYQRWPADEFTDDERPPLEDSSVQNL